AGITRRQGKMRKYIYFTPEELAGKILDSEKARVSLVFGNEEAGLTHEELALCHMAVTIPSSPLFPSLNLSHAVQVIAYEIYKASLGRKDATGKVISAEKLESVTGSIIDSLAHTGFFKKVTPESMKNFFRDILGRAMLDEREAKRLSEVFKKIRGIVTKTGDKS
ncbi:MAG: RNA methyltransferase, partial [Spirochaetales bacterium]|nr:RNA methyltransferase [Spirochaetales bacterium]